jgi:hypothetical protein
MVHCNVLLGIDCKMRNFHSVNCWQFYCERSFWLTFILVSRHDSKVFNHLQKYIWGLHERFLVCQVQQLERSSHCLLIRNAWFLNRFNCTQTWTAREGHHMQNPQVICVWTVFFKDYSYLRACEENINWFTINMTFDRQADYIQIINHLFFIFCNIVK